MDASSLIRYARGKAGLLRVLFGGPGKGVVVYVL